MLRFAPGHHRPTAEMATALTPPEKVWSPLQKWFGQPRSLNFLPALHGVRELPSAVWLGFEGTAASLLYWWMHALCKWYLQHFFLRPETGFSVWLVPHKICTAASADQWSSRLLIDWSCFRPWAMVQFMCRVLKFDSSIPRRFSQAGVSQSGVWMVFFY